MVFLKEYKNDKLWQENLNSIHIRSDLLVSERVLKILGDVKGKKILDLGCGNGKVCRWLAKKGANVTGIDIVNEQIELAKSIEKERKEGIKYYVGDVTDKNLSLAHKKFDIIISLVTALYFDKNQFKNHITLVAKYIKSKGRFIYANIHPCRVLSYLPSKGVELLSPRKNLNYFNIQQLKSKIISVDTTTTTTTYYNHPLAFIINSFLGEGFMIKKIYEPQATKSELKKYKFILINEDKLISYIIFDLTRE